MSRKTADAKPSARKQSVKPVPSHAQTRMRKNVAPSEKASVSRETAAADVARESTAPPRARTPTDRGSAASRAPEAAPTQRPGKTARILAIDIGGTGLKAALLDVDGKMTSERLRVDTPYPCPPERMIDALVDLCAPLDTFDFLSIGFPGVVRDGQVVTAPHFDAVDPDDPFAAGIMADHADAYGDDASSKKKAASHAKASDAGETPWRGFALGSAVAKALAQKRQEPVRPVQVINDAEMQGLAVIRGKGLEFVLTLGTGAGSALFRDGLLMPHLELAHHPIRGRKSYNDYVGEQARKKMSKKRWNRHVARTIAILDALLHFDHLYIGGGNAQRIAFPLPKAVTIVSNDAGIEGGAALWRDVAV